MEISRSRIQTAYDRTVRVRGEDNIDCPKFRAEFSSQLKKIVVGDYLQSSDEFEPVGVAPDGGIILWSSSLERVTA